MTPSLSDNELQLDVTLDALRGYALSFVFWALVELGVVDRLDEGLSSDELTRILPGGQSMRAGLLHYLQNEDLIERNDTDRYVLTTKGRHLSRQRGWFRLLVGGYEPVFRVIPEILTQGLQGEIRHLGSVAKGSGEITRFDAAPLAHRLLASSGIGPCRILDVGCGDGTMLCELLRHLPAAWGIGAEPSADALAAARITISRYGFADRITLVEADLQGIGALDPEPDYVIAAFVLQETLGQIGEQALVDRLSQLGQRWPRARWIIVEVDHQPASATLRSRHGLGYYNPYYLLHVLTGQVLLPRAEWERLFRAAGFRVSAVEAVDPQVDATGLELGFLLDRP